MPLITLFVFLRLLIYTMEDKPVKQSFWKNVVITTATVYPLILLSEIILGLCLPMEEVHPKMAIFLSVVIVAALMAWPVMPLVQKYLGEWLKVK